LSGRDFGDKKKPGGSRWSDRQESRLDIVSCDLLCSTNEGGGKLLT